MYRVQAHLVGRREEVRVPLAALRDASMRSDVTNWHAWLCCRGAKHDCLGLVQSRLHNVALRLAFTDPIQYCCGVACLRAIHCSMALYWAMLSNHGIC